MEGCREILHCARIRSPTGFQRSDSSFLSSQQISHCIPFPNPLGQRGGQLLALAVQLQVGGPPLPQLLFTQLDGPAHFLEHFIGLCLLVAVLLGHLIVDIAQVLQLLVQSVLFTAQGLDLLKILRVSAMHTHNDNTRG